MMKLRKMCLIPSFIFALLAVSLQAQTLVNLPDFTPIVEKEGRVVVNISTTSRVRHTVDPRQDLFFDLFKQFGFEVPPAQPEQSREQSLGSGFIIGEDGYILTNAHVVAKADQVVVKLFDKRTFKAKIVGSDIRTDIALLKIDAKGLPQARIGSTDNARVGEWVLAIGSPFGLENTVTSGILSAKGRNLPTENYVPFLQTDAAVNPGNSGGPLFNLKGEVIGVNAQIYSQHGGYMGLSFAIPIDEAMKVVQELKTKGKVTYGRLGVTLQNNFTDELAESFGLSKAEGALIASVDPGGPADKARIKPGDIIKEVNGQKIPSSEDLPRLIARIKPGTAVTITLWRNKSDYKIKAVIGEFRVDTENTTPAGGTPETYDAQNRFGLVLAEIPQRQLKQLKIPYGLYIRSAMGPAVEAGLRRGDVIVGVGAENLQSFHDFKTRLSHIKPGQSIPLRILRQEDMLFISLKAP